MARNMIFFSSQKQFFSRELAIAKPAKYIEFVKFGSTIVNAGFPKDLARTLARQ